MSIQDKIRDQVTSNRVVLYMKGTPDFPQCGFSATTVEILRRAARQAQSRGATDAAVVNLTRAWQEPPPPELIGDVAFELGTAERHAGRLVPAIAHLREAIGATNDPRRRALAAGELCTALMYTGEQTAAPVVALLDAIRALPART